MNYTNFTQIRGKDGNKCHLFVGECRSSYAHVASPIVDKVSGRKKYSVSLLIPKSNTKAVSMIEDAIKEAKILGKDTKFGGKIPPDARLKLPLRDGDDVYPEDPAYADMYFITANSEDAPSVLERGANGKSVPMFDPNEFYSGCWCVAAVDFYAFNFEGKLGIAVALKGVTKTRDDVPLSGKTTVSAEDFDAILSEDFMD